MVKAIFKLLRFPNEGPQKNKLIPIDVNFKMNLETKNRNVRMDMVIRKRQQIHLVLMSIVTLIPEYDRNIKIVNEFQN